MTNTNWQSYSPELTMGYTVQLAGLAVQNFVSAAVGIAVAVASVRGFARRKSGTIGNFWVDLFRGSFRLLLPISVVGAIILIAGGVVQNFNGFTEITTLAGNTQNLPGGPVASQEVIKELGTNGGGFFNVNSAHPFENPTGWTNLFEIALLLAIPFSLPRTFGKMVGSNKQGYAILGVMATLAVISIVALSALELNGAGTAPELAGGRDGGQGAAVRHPHLHAVRRVHDPHVDRCGELDARLVHRARRHDADAQHDARRGRPRRRRIRPLRHARARGHRGVHRGPPGGPHARVPRQEARPARDQAREPLHPRHADARARGHRALSFAIPGVREDVENVSIWNPGVHGMSEVLYAFTSASNNNGSAFAGLTANTPWLNTALGVAMLLGRFVPIVLVLALAGSLAAQDKVPATAGTLPTYRPQFVGLLVGVTVLVTALTYFPVLTLGPLAEGLN